MSVSASLVKELREKTGVGMMDCKKVLQETGGDIEAAIKSLREKGLSKAAKKSDRSTKEGRIITYIQDEQAVILELNCETDFVANNQNFKDLGETIAKAVAQNNPTDEQAVKSIDVNGSKISELISDAVLQLGENINIGQFKSLNTRGQFANYEHSNGKIGVIVEFSGGIDADTGRDIAMQVAAMNPPYISSKDVPEGDLKNETDILRQQAISEGKPEQVVEKIIEGRISKFYKENCLIEQVFVKDSGKTIQQLLPGSVDINSVERFSLVG